MQQRRNSCPLGKWARWTRYELIDGVIRPARDAALIEYDPWERFRENDGRYRTVHQPYIELVNLCRRLDDLRIQSGIQPWSPGGRTLKPVVGPQNEADQLILDWVERHGLLGIVPTVANSIRSGTKWHYLAGGVWFSFTQLRGDAPVRLDDPAVGWLNLRFRLYEAQPLKDLEPFFGANIADQGVPGPGSPEFWRDYREPIDKFVSYGRRFASDAMCLSHWRDARFARPSDGLRPDTPGDSEHEAFNVLAALAATTAAEPQLAADRKMIVEERNSPGLLASYALMFLWDRMDGRRIVRCGGCGSHFVSNEIRAGYCSVACRRTASSRRYRRRVEPLD